MHADPTSDAIDVLLVEDSPGDARIIREVLLEASGHTFNLEVVQKLTDAIARLRGGNVDAVLLDLALPDSRGAATFTQARAIAPHVPIIVLTGLGDEALALSMVRQGAQDFLVKVDINGNNLSRAIRHAIERAHAEQQIKTLNAELEQKVKDRTRQLEAANKELEAFTYSLSHDLRAPIRQIDGFANILISNPANKLTVDGTECVVHILEAVHRMQAMTTDLLKLAKISQQELVVEKTSLNALVENAVRDLKTDVERRNIEWKIGPLPTVDCDPGLMKQVFANLIGNAVKYTRNCESAVIEIGYTILNGEAVIFVGDNGAGFDMRHAGKLFRPFQRMHQSDDFEGTGVGLSTVQRIVQRQGGHIWAQSSPGNGAKFLFTLCATAAEHAPHFLANIKQ